MWNFLQKACYTLLARERLSKIKQKKKNENEELQNSNSTLQMFLLWRGFLTGNRLLRVSWQEYNSSDAAPRQMITVLVFVLKIFSFCVHIDFSLLSGPTAILFTSVWCLLMFFICIFWQQGIIIEDRRFNMCIFSKCVAMWSVTLWICSSNYWEIWWNEKLDSTYKVSVVKFNSQGYVTNMLILSTLPAEYCPTDECSLPILWQDWTQFELSYMRIWQSA